MGLTQKPRRLLRHPASQPLPILSARKRAPHRCRFARLKPEVVLRPLSQRRSRLYTSATRRLSREPPHLAAAELALRLSGGCTALQQVVGSRSIVGFGWFRPLQRHPQWWKVTCFYMLDFRSLYKDRSSWEMTIFIFKQISSFYKFEIDVRPSRRVKLKRRLQPYLRRKWRICGDFYYLGLPRRHRALAYAPRNHHLRQLYTPKTRLWRWSLGIRLLSEIYADNCISHSEMLWLKFRKDMAKPKGEYIGIDLEANTSREGQRDMYCIRPKGKRGWSFFQWRVVINLGHVTLRREACS